MPLLPKILGSFKGMRVVYGEKAQRRFSLKGTGRAALEAYLERNQPQQLELRAGISPRYFGEACLDPDNYFKFVSEGVVELRPPGTGNGAIKTADEASRRILGLHQNYAEYRAKRFFRFLDVGDIDNAYDYLIKHQNFIIGPVTEIIAKSSDQFYIFANFYVELTRWGETAAVLLKGLCNSGDFTNVRFQLAKLLKDKLLELGYDQTYIDFAVYIHDGVKDNSVKMYFAAEIGRYYLKSSPEKAIDYFNHAIAAAREGNSGYKGEFDQLINQAKQAITVKSARENAEAAKQKKMRKRAEKRGREEKNQLIEEAWHGLFILDIDSGGEAVRQFVAAIKKSRISQYLDYKVERACSKMHQETWKTFVALTQLGTYADDRTKRICLDLKTKLFNRIIQRMLQNQSLAEEEIKTLYALAPTHLSGRPARRELNPMLVQKIEDVIAARYGEWSDRNLYWAHFDRFLNFVECLKEIDLKENEKLAAAVYDLVRETKKLFAIISENHSRREQGLRAIPPAESELLKFCSVLQSNPVLNKAETIRILAIGYLFYGVGLKNEANRILRLLPADPPERVKQYDKYFIDLYSLASGYYTDYRDKNDSEDYDQATRFVNMIFSHLPENKQILLDDPELMQKVPLRAGNLVLYGLLLIEKLKQDPSRRLYLDIKQLFNRALEYMPDSPLILLNMGRAAEEFNSDEEAEDLYLKAINKGPGFYKTYASLAFLYLRLGKVGQAQKALNDWKVQIEKHIAADKTPLDNNYQFPDHIENLIDIFRPEVKTQIFDIFRALKQRFELTIGVVWRNIYKEKSDRIPEELLEFLEENFKRNL